MAKKKHKYHNSRIEIDTALPPERVLDLARQTIETLHSVKIVGGDHYSVLGAVKSLIGLKIMTFDTVVTRNGPRTQVVTSMLEYNTTQQTMYFIPISPKSIDGYSAYRKYMNALEQAVRTADPSARSIIIEREVAQRQ